MNNMLDCSYGQTTCSCEGVFNPTWNCFECPTNAPMDGASCNDDSAVCIYGPTVCNCNGVFNAQWSCETCPTTQPMNTTMCSDLGQFCGYAQASCVCLTSGWNCF
jgi:hypothetical protein